MRGFEYKKINFDRNNTNGLLIVKGEIINNSGRSYNSVVFRITVFTKTMPLGCTKAIINGFSHGQTRTIHEEVAELDYAKVIKQIANWEIIPESWY